MNSGNTPLDLQDAIISELKKLFADDAFKDPEGRKKKLSVFSQDLPIPESDDADSSLISVPYAIVRISQGEIAEVNATAETDIVIIICVYDDENNKQAYRDVLHIINKIQQRFFINPCVGNFRFIAPFEWALQDDNETFPFFFGAIKATFEAATSFVVEDNYI